LGLKNRDRANRDRVNSETVDKVINKIKETWDDTSPNVHGSHFLTPDGEIIGNYNHNDMVTQLAPMIDMKLTGKSGGGQLKGSDGVWYDEGFTPVANWKDIINFLGKTGFVRATNEGMSEGPKGHSINLTVNGNLSSSQIRAIQRMETYHDHGSILNWDIMGDEMQSGFGTFREFMQAYRKNYGAETGTTDGAILGWQTRKHGGGKIDEQSKKLLEIFGGDRGDFVGKSWLLPKGQVIQPDEARNKGGKYSWHDNFLKDAGTGCDGCVKIRSDTTTDDDPTGLLAHLHISDVNDLFTEEQLDMIVKHITEWKLDIDDVQIEDRSPDFGATKQVKDRLSKSYNANKSDFARMISQRNSSGESISDETGTTDGAVKGWATRRAGGITAGDPLQKQIMQGSITTDGGTTTSTGAKYDEWKAKQKAKQKDIPSTTDASRDDFFEKARLAREDRLKGVLNAPPAPPEERPQGKNYRDEARRTILGTKLRVETEFLEKIIETYPEYYVKALQEEINQVKSDLENVGKTELEKKLPFMPMGKNSHTKSTNGFVHGNTKINIRKDVVGHDMVRFLERAKSVWNALPDSDRDLVKTLNIKKSTSRGKIRSGSWNSETKTLNLNLKANFVEKTLYHELGHAKWTMKKEKSPEKIKKFMESVKETGISLTKYSESYRGHARRVEMLYMRKQMSIERTRSLTPEEREIIRIVNVRAKDLYENETHAELNAYAMGFMPPERIIAGDASTKKLMNAYNEVWEL
jgi:hypothetical protein